MALTSKERYEIHKHFNFTCQRCGRKEDPNWRTLYVHHKKKVARGGSDDLSNLTLVCKRCHMKFYHKPKSRKGRQGKTKKKYLSKWWLGKKNC